MIMGKMYPSWCYPPSPEWCNQSFLLKENPQGSGSMVPFARYFRKWKFQQKPIHTVQEAYTLLRETHETHLRMHVDGDRKWKIVKYLFWGDCSGAYMEESLVQSPHCPAQLGLALELEVTQRIFQDFFWLYQRSSKESITLSPSIFGQFPNQHFRTTLRLACC